MAEQLKVRIIGDDSELKAKVSESRKRLNEFRKQAETDAKVQIKLEIGKLQTELDQARKLLRQFKKDGDKNGEIATRVQIQNLQEGVKVARSQLRSLDQATDSTKKGFFNLNTITKDTLKVLGGFVTLRTVANTLTDAFNAATDFESAFAGVRKTVDASEEEFQALETSFRDLVRGPNGIPVAIEELLKIGELGGQLGVAKEGLVDFTETIAKLGVTTNLTTEEAATEFARISNILQIPIEQTENLGSAVVAVGNNFATTEKEVVNFTNRIAGAGKIAGFTASDLVGISTAFTSVGIEAEAGGTAVQKTILTINDAVAQGGAELEQFASLTGQSADEFAQQWRTAPVQAFDRFVKSLGESGDDASKILGELVGEDVRLQRAFLSVANAGDLLTRAVKTSNTAFVANTALSDEANKRFETTASKIQAIKNDFNDLAIDFGRKLQPVVLQTLEFLQALANGLIRGTGEFANLGNQLKFFGTVLAGILSVAALKKFTNAILESARGIVALEQGVKKAEVANLGFGASLKTIGRSLIASFLNPVNLVILGLGFMVTSILDNIRRMNELQAASDSLRDTLNILGEEGLQRGVGDRVNELTEKLKALNAEILNMQFAGSNEFLDPSFNQKLEERTVLIDDFKGELVKLGESFGYTEAQTNALIEELELFKNGANLSKEQTEALENALSEKLGKSLNDIIPKFEKTFDTFKKSSKTTQEAFAKTVNAFGDDFQKFHDKGDSLTQQLLNTLIRRAGQTGEVGEAFTLGLSNGMTRPEIVNELEKAGLKITGDVLGVLLGESVKAGKIGETYALLVALGIDEKSAQAAVSAQDLATGVKNALENAGPSIFDSALVTGRNIVQSFANGIYNKLPQLEGAVNSIGRVLNAVAPGASDFIGKIQKVIAAGRASTLESYNNSVSATERNNVITPKSGGGGGGGSSKSSSKSALEKEAEKAAQDAAKDAEDRVEDLGDALAKLNKKSADLRDRVKEFFQGIVDSISDARDKIKTLTEDLNSFKEEETKDFFTDVAKRNLELLDDEKSAQEELLSLQKKRAETTDEEGQKSIDNDILSVQEELKKIADEKLDIDALRSELGEKELKQLEDTIALEKERAALSETALLKKDFDEKIKQKEDETKAEIEKQKRIINIQEQFLDLQQQGDEQAAVKRFQLYQLSNQDFEANREEILAKLKELGFQELDDEEALMLLRQAQQARRLELETNSILRQQEVIVSEKEKFFQQTEDAHAASTDRMKDKTEELIKQIRIAQQEQVRLNALSGGGGGGGGGGNTSTTNNNVNIQQNINSQEDALSFGRYITNQIINP